MTEINIFSKQLHSVAALAFIAVLIVLLLILTVMVHMRNRKLKRTLEEQMAERRLLDKICADFTAVYYVELNTGSFEILHINDGTNAKKMNLKQCDNFNYSADQYAVQYLYEEERQEFKNWISTGHLKEQLSRKERITYHYRSKPNPNRHEFFEAQAIKIFQDEKHFFALVGFRHIDDIMEKETTIQNQLKQALDEARLSNEIISAIAKSYCSIYRIDVQKDFFEEVSNDSEVHKLTGNSGCASEKLYQICDTMVAPEYRPLIRPFLDVSTLLERLKTEECISTEYRMCDGSWHRMLFIVKKRDESGNVTHVLCTVRSISDSKRREEDLNFAAEAAKREAEMKTRFLATMSHDIRTPLNGIIGMVNMENQYADDPQIQQKIREKTMEALKYLVSLVNDVLDMNKLQSGDLKDQQLLFDLTMVLRELNQIYEERATKKGIRYEIGWKNGKYSHIALVGNPVYLGRILSNIMDNAIKFSQAGSVITVWVKEETLDDGRAFFTFYCKDQGVGMSEDFIAHAFDMFSQESKTSRSRYEGTGLGLAITKQLVDRMNGTIELKSKVGVGTTVIVKIPFKIGTQDKNGNLSDKPVSLDDYSVEGMRALVVEDNELNMEIARCILEDSGMEVTCAADGKEAVEIFEKSAPDYFGVIYMDIMMPRMNGLDAARTIREMQRRDARRIPIIAISANSFAEDIINSRMAGMNVHLAKPLDTEKMIAALKQCMTDNRDIKLHEDL